MTTFNQALAANDSDAVGLDRMASAGQSSAAAAASANLLDRYPDMILPAYYSTPAGVVPTANVLVGINEMVVT